MKAHDTITPAARGKNVALLASSAIVSGIGTGASLIGVPWAIHSFTGSTVLISSYFMIAYGSLIVLLPKFSSIIDRPEFEDVRHAPARIASKIAGPVAPAAGRHSYTRPKKSLAK